MRSLAAPGQDRLAKISKGEPIRESQVAPSASDNTGGPVLRGDKSSETVEACLKAAVILQGSYDRRKPAPIPRSHSGPPEISTHQAATAVTATDVAIHTRPVTEPLGAHADAESTVATRAHPGATAEVHASAHGRAPDARAQPIAPTTAPTLTIRPGTRL